MFITVISIKVSGSRRFILFISPQPFQAYRVFVFSSRRRNGHHARGKRELFDSRDPAG